MILSLLVMDTSNPERIERKNRGHQWRVVDKGRHDGGVGGVGGVGGAE